MENRYILKRYIKIMPYATARDFKRFIDVTKQLGYVGAFVALELSLMALNSK